mgnify:CR=1 FL=1
MKVFRRAAGAGESAQPGGYGLGSLSRQIAAAAVAIVAVAIVFVVMAIARYNDARTRADLHQKVTALTLMVVNAAPSLILSRDNSTLGYILTSLQRDPDFNAGIVADDIVTLASAGRTPEARLSLTPRWLAEVIGEEPWKALQTRSEIDIEDDGTVKIASSDGNSIKAAINWIKSIASDPEVGQIYEGTVVKTVDFGAFVNFFGSKDGLVHISQLALGRVAKTTDVVKEGDKVKVKLLGFDDRGKVRLSMRVVDQETGEDLEAKQKAERDAQKAAEAGE